MLRKFALRSDLSSLVESWIITIIPRVYLYQCPTNDFSLVRKNSRLSLIAVVVPFIRIVIHVFSCITFRPRLPNSCRTARKMRRSTTERRVFAIPRLNWPPQYLVSQNTGIIKWPADTHDLYGGSVARRRDSSIIINNRRPCVSFDFPPSLASGLKKGVIIRHLLPSRVLQPAGLLNRKTGYSWIYEGSFIET